MSSKLLSRAADRPLHTSTNKIAITGSVVGLGLGILLVTTCPATIPIVALALVTTVALLHIAKQMVRYHDYKKNQHTNSKKYLLSEAQYKQCSAKTLIQLEDLRSIANLKLQEMKANDEKVKGFFKNTLFPFKVNKSALRSERENIIQNLRTIHSDDKAIEIEKAYLKAMLLLHIEALDVNSPKYKECSDKSSVSNREHARGFLFEQNPATFSASPDGSSSTSTFAKASSPTAATAPARIFPKEETTDLLDSPSKKAFSEFQNQNKDYYEKLDKLSMSKLSMHVGHTGLINYDGDTDTFKNKYKQEYTEKVVPVFMEKMQESTPDFLTPKNTTKRNEHRRNKAAQEVEPGNSSGLRP